MRASLMVNTRKSSSITSKQYIEPRPFHQSLSGGTGGLGGTDTPVCAVLHAARSFPNSPTWPGTEHRTNAIISLERFDMPDISIRPAMESDLPRLTEIYNYYVTTTPVTFDVEPYTRSEEHTSE